MGGRQRGRDGGDVARDFQREHRLKRLGGGGRIDELPWFTVGHGPQMLRKLDNRCKARRVIVRSAFFGASSVALRVGRG